MANPLHAWPAGSDPRELARSIAAAHDEFLANGRADSAVRSVVARSWERCLRDGVDPERSLAPVHLVGDELAEHRDAHPLARVMPVIRRLLVGAPAHAAPPRLLLLLRCPSRSLVPSVVVVNSLRCPYRPPGGGVDRILPESQPRVFGKSQRSGARALSTSSARSCAHDGSTSSATIEGS